MKPLLTPVLLLASAFWLLRGLAPGVCLEDAGELAASAMTLGNTHSPGHPWHSMAGKLAMYVPCGSPAFRMSLLSVLCILAAVAALWRALAWIGPRVGLDSRLAGVAGCAAFLFSRTAWWQSGIGEKHALSVAFFSWAFLAIARALVERDRRSLVIGALLTGLALGHHLSGLYLLPPLLWALGRDRDRRLGAIVLMLLVMTLGFKVLYSPLRAAADPSVNWHDPDRLTRLADYLSARSYVAKFVLGERSLREVGSALRDQALVQPWKEFGPVLLLVPLGIWRMWRADRKLAKWMALLVVSNVVIALACRTPAVERLYLPSWWLLALFAGIGSGALAARREIPGFRIVRMIPKPAAPTMVVVLLVLQIGHSANFARRDRDYLAPDHIRAMLANVGEGGVVVANGDPWLLPLFYANATGQMPPRTMLVPGGALVHGAPGRDRMATGMCGSPDCLDEWEAGPALVWHLARKHGGGGVYLTQGTLLGQIPSRGAQWRGFILRITRPGADFAVGSPPNRVRRALAARSFLAPSDLFERVLVTHYAQAMLEQGRILLERGHPREAVRAARLGLRIGIAAGDLAERTRMELLNLAGRAHLRNGESGPAVQEFELAAIMSDATSLDALVGLAEAARAEGRPGDTLLFWRRAAALAVGVRHEIFLEAYEDESKGRKRRAVSRYALAVSLGYVGQGRAVFRAGRLCEARRSWERALELDPDSPRAFQELGTLAMAEERFGDAERLYSRSRDLDGVFPGIEEALTLARSARRAHGELVALRERARSSSGPDELCDLGNAFWHLGRLNVAETVYRRTIAIDPGFARAWGNLGSVFVRRGSLRKGIAAYQRALEIDPEYVEAMLNLVSAYGRNGENRKARLMARRALKVRPDNEEAKRLLAGLGGGES